MKIFLDTEFDGFGGPLISIALVTEDGDECYYVLEHEAKDEWVLRNVIPVLGPQEPLTRTMVARFLVRFLQRYSRQKIEIVADWPDDLIHLNQLLLTGPGTMMAGVPLELTMVLDRNRGYSSKIPHNALEDARAMRVSYQESRPAAPAPTEWPWEVSIDTSDAALARFAKALLKTGSKLKDSMVAIGWEMKHGVSATLLVTVPVGKEEEFKTLAKVQSFRAPGRIVLGMERLPDDGHPGRKRT